MILTIQQEEKSILEVIFIILAVQNLILDVEIWILEMIFQFLDHWISNNQMVF